MLAQKYLTRIFQLLTLFALVFGNILLLFGCMSVINDESGENMIFIPEGSFTMGFEIDNSNEWGDMDEEPMHRVILSSYWIDKYEVTSSNFSTFLNKNKNEAHRFIEITPAVTIELKNNMYRPRKGLENFPVNRVSWFGANAYCRWKGKRLPTEAEWEKAACWDENNQRKTIFPWGNESPDLLHANLLESYIWNCSEIGAYPNGKSHYGCHQMIGDVWEWTSTEFSGYPGFKTGFSEYNDKWFSNQKVLRGGSFGTPSISIRGSYRNFFRLDERWMFSGFRCAGYI